MISKKKISTLAKAMLRESLIDGYVDSAKVKKVLETIMSKKPAGITAILKTYKKLIESLLSKEKVTVKTAIPVFKNKQSERFLLQKTSAKKIEYKIDRHMVFGSKITYGDWVIDGTLQAKLEQLTGNI